MGLCWLGSGVLCRFKGVLGLMGLGDDLIVGCRCAEPRLICHSGCVGRSSHWTESSSSRLSDGVLQSLSSISWRTFNCPSWTIHRLSLRVFEYLLRLSDSVIEPSCDPKRPWLSPHLGFIIRELVLLRLGCVLFWRVIFGFFWLFSNAVESWFLSSIFLIPSLLQSSKWLGNAFHVLWLETDSAEVGLIIAVIMLLKGHVLPPLSYLQL